MKFPLRQVHLDFHTSRHVAGVGADFDPDIFAQSLFKIYPKRLPDGIIRESQGRGEV